MFLEIRMWSACKKRANMQVILGLGQWHNFRKSRNTSLSDDSTIFFGLARLSKNVKREAIAQTEELPL